jgi:penicillin-binding protein 2
MIAAVANGGTLIQPHFLKNDIGAKPDYFQISDDTVRQVTDGMWGVVNEPDGTTSGLVKLENIDFSGKTGTAQVESFELQNKLGKKLKENGWFVGLAPRRNPEIVVAALVQRGGWGSTSAAPIVRDVVKAYYDKKSGEKDLTYTAKDGKPAIVPAYGSGPIAVQAQADPVKSDAKDR